MTPEEFELAVSKTRLRAHTSAAARSVLVDGLGLTQAGNASTPRMTRQQVSDAVGRIEREHLKSIGAPQGWGCITLVLPRFSEDWDEANELQKRAYERAGLRLPNAVLSGKPQHTEL